MADSGDIKQLRYQVMLALYLPILLYSFSTFDLDETTFAVKEVKPVIVGDQNIVLGQPYTARAYLTAASKVQLQSPDDRMTVMGDTSLQMPTGNLLGEDENVKDINYTAIMQYEQVNKEMAQTEVRGSFTVRRPELVATSVATQSLYRQTLNQIRIDVPGLENQPLKLEANGNMQDGRQLRLSPAGQSVTVRAFLASNEEEDVFLGSKEFAVIDPPRPEIKVLDATGNQLTSGDAFSKARPVLDFEIEPDREYESSYPQDARYQIRRARVSIRKGLAASQEIGTFNLSNGSELRLVRELRDARPKDQILVQLQGVVRINHAGQAIPVQLSEASRSFSFVLS
ncbi:MAG: hypothetical protein GVY25_11980 [Bacteroidetes bacterium]|jgi:hypothetical protein|nr:hypothetical protein [Bacteroidota bacterium]